MTGCIPVVSRVEAAPEPKTYRNGRETHGHYRLERQIKLAIKAGRRVFSRRTIEGRALETDRLAFIEALGGEEGTSPQQREVVNQIITTRLLISHIDVYLVELGPKIINRRYKRLAPVVQQRTALADSLLRQLQAIGLERRARPVESLRAQLEAAREES